MDKSVEEQLILILITMNNLLTAVADFGKFIFDLPIFAYYLVSSLVKAGIKKVFPSRRKFDGETILITGAASGIGQDLSVQLSQQAKDLTLILWDINEAGLLETVEKCRELGAKAIPYRVDLSNRDDVTRIAKKVREEVGFVTTLVNNAGIAVEKLFLDADPDMEEKVIKINFMSNMWTIREFLPDMIMNGRGHIVCTISGLGFYRWKGLSSYVASKYALRGFLETLRVELLQHPKKPAIKISSVFPSWVKTPMTKDQITWEARYSSFAPLECSFAAKKMIEGMKREEREIMIPGGIKWTDVFFRVYPVEFFDKMEKYLFQERKFSSTRH